MTDPRSPDMPKYQPCPQCGKQSRRDSKTLGGANYVCRRHGKFFVKAPARRKEVKL